MNKKQLASRIFKKLDIPRSEAYNFIDSLIESISAPLARGEKVVISNFGTFKVITRLKKRVIIPNTREEMNIPERKIIKFIPSNKLKEIVRK